MSLAARLIAKRRTFQLFENNSQNFVKFLLEELCPGVPIPDTIKDILQRLEDVSTVAEAYGNVLPGGYPTSVTSSACTSFVTATGTTWFTASGETWVTAVEYFSSNDSNYSQSLSGVPPNGITSLNNRFNILKIAETRLRWKTAIIGAVTEGDVRKLTDLLGVKGNLAVSDKETGQTPMHIAVEQDNPCKYEQGLRRLRCRSTCLQNHLFLVE